MTSLLETNQRLDQGQRGRRGSYTQKETVDAPPHFVRGSRVCDRRDVSAGSGPGSGHWNERTCPCRQAVQGGRLAVGSLLHDQLPAGEAGEEGSGRGVARAGRAKRRKPHPDPSPRRLELTAT